MNVCGNVCVRACVYCVCQETWSPWPDLPGLNSPKRIHPVDLSPSPLNTDCFIHIGQRSLERLAQVLLHSSFLSVKEELNGAGGMRGK